MKNLTAFIEFLDESELSFEEKAKLIAIFSEKTHKNQEIKLK